MKHDNVSPHSNFARAPELINKIVWHVHENCYWCEWLRVLVSSFASAHKFVCEYSRAFSSLMLVSFDSPLGNALFACACTCSCLILGCDTVSDASLSHLFVKLHLSGTVHFQHTLQSLFNTPFVHISNLTWYPWGDCNSTTLQTHPLLPRMILCCQSSKAGTTYKLWSCTNIPVSLFCMQVPQGAYNFTKYSVHVHVTNTITTKNAFFLQVQISHDLPFSVSRSV